MINKKLQATKQEIKKAILKFAYEFINFDSSIELTSLQANMIHKKINKALRNF